MRRRHVRGWRRPALRERSGGGGCVPATHRPRDDRRAGARGQRLSVRERLRRHERLGFTACSPRALVPSARGPCVRKFGLWRQATALLTGFERGSRGLRGAVSHVSTDALADGSSPGTARRGAAARSGARRPAGNRRAGCRPCAAAAGRPGLRRASERGRVNRPFRRAIPACARLAAGTDRRAMAAHRRGGVPRRCPARRRTATL